MNSLFVDIPNRTSRAEVFKTSAYNIVSDYHSYRSCFLRQNDWFVRLYLDYVTHPDLAYYLFTFTYRPACCPVYNVRTSKFSYGYNPCNKSLIPLFSRAHQQNFFKKFRKLVSGPVRYLWCSEFGKRFTKRPHYHAIIGVSSSIPYQQVLSFVRSCWSYSSRVKLPGTNLVRNVSFPLGRVDLAFAPGSHSPFVSQAEGFRYASKYITKDTYLSEDSRFVSLSDDVKERLRPYMPFKSSSLNMGADWQSYVDVDTALFKGVPIPVLSRSKGVREVKYYPLPKFCVDRFFYEHVYSVHDRFRHPIDSVSFERLVVDNYHFASFDEHKQFRSLLPLLKGFHIDDVFSCRYCGVDWRVYPPEVAATFLKSNKIRVHTKKLKDNLRGLFVRYTRHLLETTARKWSVVMSKPLDFVRNLLLYSKVRSLIVPSRLLARPLSLCHVWQYYIDSLTSSTSVPYMFGYNGVRPLVSSHCNDVLGHHPFFVGFEKDLQEFYGFMLSRSESIIKSFRVSEDNAKFARESFRGF